jgi:hypothetical protein
MVARKKQNPPGSPDGLNLNFREKRAAVHEPQIPPTVTPTQVARRRVARPKAPTLEEKWRITKRLAALRCAARAVMAIEVGGKVAKAYIIHHPDDHWSPHVNAHYVYYAQIAKAFVAPLVAEILFAKKPPPKSREWEAVAQPHAVCARLLPGDPGTGVRRPRQGVSILWWGLPARHL